MTSLAVSSTPENFTKSPVTKYRPACPLQASSQIIYASLRPCHLGVYHHVAGRTRLIGATQGFEMHPLPTPDGQAVIYSSTKAGSHHLYLRSLVDGCESKLTDHNFFEDHPRFDGHGNLYFCSDFGGSVHIYRTAWRGQTIAMQNAEKITTGHGNRFSFCLAPDSREIVFSSNQDNLEGYQGPQPAVSYQAGRLYKMRIGEPATCQLLLTCPVAQANSYWEGTPTYSKDGKYIFYYSTLSGKPQLYRYDTTTEQCLPLTSAQASALYPSTTTDRQVLFSYQKRADRYWKIKTMHFDGSGVQTLLSLQQHCWAPQLLADGSLVCYGTVNLGKLPIDCALPHGEGPFLVDEGLLVNKATTVALKAIRGYFPVVDQGRQRMSYIEPSMRKIMQCNLDGSAATEIFKVPVAEKMYVFSLSSALDGSLITTVGVPFGNGTSHLMLLSPGKEPVNLTERYPQARNTAPAITRDGQTIVFSRQMLGQRKHLFSIDSQGKELTQLTFDADQDDVFATISPCGKLIAFSATVDKKTYRLRLLHREKGTSKELTQGFVDIHACFAPDGCQLIFTSNRGGHKAETPLSFFFNPQAYGDNYTLDLDSRHITQLTSSPYEDSTPTWI